MPAVYQLLGFPGSGKYTVARAIVDQLATRGEPAALLDNHATANLIWSLVPPARRFEPRVLARMNELRAVVIGAAAELTDAGHSIVLTNFVPAPQSADVLEPHRALAQQLGKPLVAVMLRCDADEVLRRVPSPERAERHKLVNADVARAIMERGMPLPDWPELVELDTNGLSAAETATRVIALADDR